MATTAVVTLLTSFMVYSCGCEGYSAVALLQCTSDPQCPEGYFCYHDSQYCTPCMECSTYKRKSSWRACPKTPSDCGACLPGFEEEVMHEGRLRDMCVPEIPNPLSHTNDSGASYERYLWAAAVTALFLPVVFYAFCWKNSRRERFSIRGVPNEEPPPYRSIELTTLTSNNSEERLAEEGHVMRVGQQKDSLVQAVPFRQPDYIESELLAFDNAPEAISDDADSEEDRVIPPPEVDLHDENTMPSDWTPAENNGNGQLLSFGLSEPEVSADSEETSCEPASKRYKTNNTPEDEESCNTHLNINLFINNSVTIHKPS